MALSRRPLDHDVMPGLVALVAINVALVLGLVVAPGSAVLVLGAAIAIPVCAYLIRALIARPQRGILVLAALLPFDGLLIISPLPAIADGWKEALIALTLGATLVSPPEVRAPKGRPAPSWWPVLVAFFGFAVVSAAVQHDYQGLVGLKVTFFMVLIAIAVWRCPLDRHDRDRLVTIIMATGAITAIFGVLQQLLGADRLASLGWEFNSNIRFAGGILRSFSTFNNNFAFALFLMFVLLIGLPFAFAAPRRTRSQLFFLLLPVIFVALGLTVTRAAWVGLVVGVLYLGATRFKPVLTVLVRGMIVAALLLVVFGGFATSFLSERSYQERIDIWEANVSQIVDHPFGLGIGATGSAAEKIADQEGDVNDALQPDNYYLKTTLELGVIGLWIFLILLVTTFSAAHSAARMLSPPDSTLAYGVAAMVLAAAAISTSATYFEVFPMDAYFWLLLAVVASCVHESRSTR